MSQPPDSNQTSVRGDTPTEGATWDSTLLEATLPEQIGVYRILSRIGEGGIGIVYKAEQREPVKRVVALKIIKLGMDTREVVQRFAAERQALAMMDHPNVARVFDAGSTPTGRPYFVMELVAGEPITEYCDRHSLTVRQRLELFLQICAAVGHAHQKGIIHRDLKPTNILVAVKDGAALAKVIDFGIAKAISTRLTDNTLYTEQGQLIGTPEYMSPEQAEMSATEIDTRSDIYSLGVMLYELLAGAPPVDSKTLRRHAYAEIQRIIREVDPPSPSLLLTRLSADLATKVAERRRVTALSLTAELKRELEWIPLKAMRKDRTERYQTARDLANDIQNYLQGLPLSAGPESTLYRAQKFVRRNKAPVTVTGLIAILLIVCGLVSVVLLKTVREKRSNEQERQQLVELKEAAEKDRAEAQRQRAEAEKAKEAAMAAVTEMATNVRGLSDLSPETKQQIFTNGILAVMSKDPAFVASIIKQMSERTPGPPPGRTGPATRPMRPPPGARRPPG